MKIHLLHVQKNAYSKKGFFLHEGILVILKTHKKGEP